MVPLPLTSAGPQYGPIELVTKKNGKRDEEKNVEKEEEKYDDNEGNIENADENDNQVGLMYLLIYLFLLSHWLFGIIWELYVMRDFVNFKVVFNV